MLKRLKTIGLVLACVCSLNAYAGNPDKIQFAWAVERGDLKQVKEWFKDGLDPSYEGNVIGSGLMIGAWTGNIDMMQLFLDNGADINQINRSGEQALAFAAWNGHKHAVDWLIANGAMLNRKEKSWGALHYATFNGHTELVKHLIAKGADVNARVPNGATAIMLAAREGKDDIAKMLLSNGASLKYKTDWNDTALTMAVRTSHLAIAKMVSTPEEFAYAINNTPETTGMQRSVEAPKHVSEILAQIREANRERMPTHALQAQLADAIKTYRSEHTPKNTSGITKVNAIEITAKRGGNGSDEKVRIITR